MGKRSLVIFAVLVSALVASGCGSDSDSDSKAETTTTRERTTTTVSAEAAKLEARLIKTVPAGYTQEADDVGDTGPSDLEKAIRDDGEADARARLTKDGFVAGYQRLWTSGDNAIIDFLYQFSSPAGVSDYFERTISAVSEGDAETTITEFAVTGIPGAKGYLAHATDGDAVVIVLARGNYLAQVQMNGTDATAANANSLATQQYNNLA